MRRALHSRTLGGYVATRPLRRGKQNRAGQCSRPGTDFDYTEVVGLPKAVELGIDPASKHRTEQRTNFWRCDEVAATTRRTATGTTSVGVEPLLAVERYLEVFIEAQLIAQGRTPARSVIAPTFAIRPGSTPNARVVTPQMSNAACTEP